MAETITNRILYEQCVFQLSEGISPLSISNVHQPI